MNGITGIVVCLLNMLMTLFTVFSLTAAICAPDPEPTNSVINSATNSTDETVNDEGACESETNPSESGKTFDIHPF